MKPCLAMAVAKRSCFDFIVWFVFIYLLSSCVLSFSFLFFLLRSTFLVFVTFCFFRLSLNLYIAFLSPLFSQINDLSIRLFQSFFLSCSTAPSPCVSRFSFFYSFYLLLHRLILFRSSLFFVIIFFFFLLVSLFCSISENTFHSWLYSDCTRR